MFGNVQLGNQKVQLSRNSDELLRSFLDLCDAINQRGQSLILRVVKKQHLVLDNQQIEQLANQYGAALGLVDQLVRIWYFGKKWNENRFGRHTDDDGNDYQAKRFKHFEVLYHKLFFGAGRWKSFKEKSVKIKQFDDGNVFYYTHDLQDSGYQGLLTDVNGYLLAVFFKHCYFSKTMMSYYLENHELRYYNFERYTIPHDSRFELGYILFMFALSILVEIFGFVLSRLPLKLFDRFEDSGWLWWSIGIFTFFLLVVPLVCLIYWQVRWLFHSRYTKDGLLRFVNYAKDDPGCLVLKYRLK